MPMKGDLISQDARFKKVSRDPRFWEMPEKERKIQIDKRFQGMFNEKRFKLKYTVDKRGRPIQHTSKEDLKRFYQLSDSDDNASDSDNTKEAKTKQTTKDENSESDDGDEETSEKKSSIKNKKNLVKTQRAKEKALISSQKTEHTGQLSSTTFGNADVKTKQTQSAIEKAKKIIVKVKSNKKGDISELEDESEKFEGAGSHRGSAEENDDKDAVTSRVSKKGTQVDSAAADDGDDDDDDDDDDDSEPDIARGVGNMESSSDEEDFEEMLNEEPEMLVEHAWGEIGEDASRADNVTRRLAVCNIDWDRIKAKDLLVLFDSFKPKCGVVMSVKIYPSEYGKERMEHEKLHGPAELADNTLPDDIQDSQLNAKDEVFQEQLRKYQFNRLKYFYAVVQCDSPETANAIYEGCDRMEYEASSSFIDLRFIPDGMTFDDEPVDSAIEVDSESYKPKHFTSAALGMSKVELTWEETDHERVQTLMKRDFTKDEILEMDVKAYLASSSEDDDEDEEPNYIIQEPQEDIGEKEVTQLHAKPSGSESASLKKNKKVSEEEMINKYRELLKGINEEKTEERDMEMEITWVPGLKETAEEMVKKKLEGKDALTPWEQYLEKRKEKKRQKREEKKKHKDVQTQDLVSDEELPPDVDLSDEFHREELQGTEASKKGKKKKTKGKKEQALTSEETVERVQQEAELALLMMDDEEEDKKHFNYDNIVDQQNLSKRKKKKMLKKREVIEEDTFQVDVEDPRFTAVYTSHLYNIDPSDSSFRKTKGTEALLMEKGRKRRLLEKEKLSSLQHQSPAVEALAAKGLDEKKKGVDPALSLLIKSVKSKTEQFHASKKKKM
ncbi:ESF1 homolog [Lampetra planeri]